ncbi:MAG: SDR family oxidoreductase [Syntrophaceae bacterium]|nr:SDR family oxidoreductase [Syntrophaceae bacterium]
MIIRISVSALREKREQRSSRILLTGATGFLGSHIAAEMLRRGFSLWVLCRPKKQLTGQERFRRILDWLREEIPAPSKVRVVEGHLEQPRFGLDERQYSEMLSQVDEIVHCASNTSFSERKRAEVEAVNIAGLQRVLEAAAQSRCHFFHHLSTAYVAGKKEGVFREERVTNQDFHNLYEETKCLGERLVAELCAREGIRCTIYRPSIVYGDSRTGRALTFRALYYPVRTVLFFKNLYRADILENGGGKAKEMGVRMDRDGWVHLPIRLEKKENGGINLVPVDFFLQAFMALWGDALEGGIFHLVNPRPKKIDELVDFTSRLFRITGIRAVPPGDFLETPRNPLEVLFHAYLDAYHPYMRDGRVFDSREADSILRRRNILCPDLDYEIFSRCMNYAVASGWGQKRKAEFGRGNE